MIEHFIDSNSIRLNLEKVPINHWRRDVLAYRDSNYGYFIVYPIKDDEIEFTWAKIEYHTNYGIGDTTIIIRKEYDYYEGSEAFTSLIENMRHKARLARITIMEYKPIGEKKDE